MIKSDFLICNDIKEWEMIFCSFLDGKYSLLKLEEYLNETIELEKEIGEALYLKLISFNFKSEDNFEEIKELIVNYLFSGDTRVFYKWKICLLLKESGCHINKSILDSKESYKNSPDLLLKLYGGFEIGEIGTGLEQTKSSIVFMKKPLLSDLDDSWEKIIGPVVQIGMAHHQNIIIFMNEEGVFYIYIDLINKMYLGGSFQETLSKLLLGLDYGKLISLPTV